jgi:hypothetical protein
LNQTHALSPHNEFPYFFFFFAAVFLVPQGEDLLPDLHAISFAPPFSRDLRDFTIPTLHRAVKRKSPVSLQYTIIES